MKANTRGKCYANHSCYQPLHGPGDLGDTAPFGVGPAAGGHFTWWSTEQLGANPHGEQSASHISGAYYSSAGFVAAFRPFFSEECAACHAHGARLASS